MEGASASIRPVSSSFLAVTSKWHIRQQLLRIGALIQPRRAVRGASFAREISCDLVSPVSPSVVLVPGPEGFGWTDGAASL